MFFLMTLPYEFCALEPVLSSKTLELHYSRHHKGYVEKTNELVLQNALYTDLSLGEVTQKSYDHKHWNIFNNSAQVIAHNFYWKSLTPCEELQNLKFGALRQHIENTFTSVEKMIEQWMCQGIAHFGSGWSWLIYNKKTNMLEITSTSNALLPWVESTDIYPLLTVDLWEHAYYVDYYNHRKTYLEKIFQCLNWNFAEQQYKHVHEYII
ncbi:superoxide dismutase [Fe] [Holospora obtusa F1]|uniref:Superoxide dismutase n=1 Tax=Holospora obtusa F1 TaxID=1399147 RepID=W6TFD4_HOLOB|nr:superoxide dismutase [Holospora obtusa]ETZ07704.1 superoxide dismutase [Fe] [Holospora obtusa F1]